MMIYHITSRDAWHQAQLARSYSAPSLATEGFIHASTHQQIVDTANRYYQGKEGLVILEIDTDLLASPLRFEEAPGLGQQFPHIYGLLQVAAVARVLDFSPQADGRFQMPIQLAE